jgi:hypothetical protein
MIKDLLTTRRSHAPPACSQAIRFCIVIEHLRGKEEGRRQKAEIYEESAEQLSSFFLLPFAFSALYGSD